MGMTAVEQGFAAQRFLQRAFTLFTHALGKTVVGQQGMAVISTSALIGRR
jgi:hypothetical protein